MTREWQPGDVAKSVDHGYIGILVDGCWNTLHDAGQHWHNSEGGWDRADHPRRPLVVIDPEDREQVERLNASIQHGDSRSLIDNLQAALREFADPSSPRPDEPLLLGAVIEDKNGRLWTRAGSSFMHGNWLALGTTEYVEFSDIASPRVLSPGYDPEATS